MRKALLIIILIVGLSYLAANLEPVQRLAIGFGTRYLKDELEIDLEVGEVKGNLFHNLTFTDLKIGAAAEIKRLEVSYNPFSIISGRFYLKSISVIEPHIKVDEALKIRLKREAAPAPPAIDIGQLTIESGMIEYQKRKIPLSLSLSYLNGLVELDGLTITLPNSRIITKGDYDPEGEVEISYQVDLDLKDINLGEGKISSQGVVAGSSSDPTGLGSLEFSSVTIPRIRFRYEYDEGRIRITDLSFSSEGFSLNGGLVYAIAKDSLRADLKGLAGRERLNIICIYQKGKLSSEIRSREWALNLEGEIGKEVCLKLAGHYLGSQITGRIDYADNRLVGMIDARSLTISEGVCIREIAVNLQSDLGGDVKTGRIDLAVRGIHYLESDIGDIDAKLTVKDDKVQILSSGLLEGKGVYSLKPPNRIYFGFLVDNLDLSSIIKEGGGRLYLKGIVNGILSGKNGPDLQISIERLSAEVNETEIRTTEPFRIHSSASRVTIEPARFDLDGSSICVEGAVSDELDLLITTHNFDLGIISSFLTDQKVSGGLDAEIGITGKQSEPRFGGSLRLNRLLIKTPDDTIGPTDILLTMKDNTIAITNLQLVYRNIAIKNEGLVKIRLIDESIIIERSRVKVNGETLSFEGIIPIR
ncbi:MAG TPA: hypothetical protein EYP58_02380, partial [bacterium (Candidatus Stahlbacteria)]|nr:hypothetical protein [Candidatus Stahlbacteria bacterium]